MYTSVYKNQHKCPHYSVPGRKPNALVKQFVNMEKVSRLCGQSRVCFVICIYLYVV